MTPAIPAEKEIWTGRPSFWNWWPQLAIGDLLLLLAAALWWADLSRFAPIPIAAAVLFYAYVLAGHLGLHYTISSQRVSSREGLLSKRVDEVEIRDIRNIVLEQSFMQRLVGIGDIGISSAGTDGVEVRFTGVSGAPEVKEEIRRARMAQGGSGGE